MLISGAMALLALAGALEDPATPRLFVELELYDERAWYLELPEAPTDTDAMMTGLLKVLEAEEIRDAVSRGYAEFDLMDDAGAYVETQDDGSWRGVVYLEGKTAPKGKLTRDVPIAIEPLRVQLLNAGYSELHLFLHTPRGSDLSVSGLELDGYGDGKSKGRVAFDLHNPIPPVNVRYGRESGTLAGHLLLMAALLLFPGAVLLRVRKRLQALPREEIGWAYVRGQNAYSYVVLLFWLLWINAVGLLNLPLLSHFAAVEHPEIWSLAGILITALLGLAGAVCSQLVLHPVYLKHDGLMSTRRDLLSQAFSFNLYLAAIFGLARAAIIFTDDLAHYGIMFGVTVICLYVAARMSRHAFGLRVAPLENPAVQARVAEFQARAGAKPRPLMLFSADKAPLVFYPPGMYRLFALKEFIFQRFSQREADAFLARVVVADGMNCARRGTRRTRFFLVFCFASVIIVTIISKIVSSYPPLDHNIFTLFFSSACLCVAIVALYRLLVTRCHRLEYAVDEATVTFTADPEGFISAWYRTCRACAIPATWDRKTERWMSHPSPANRIARIAKKAEIDDETLARIKREGLEEPSGYYAHETTE